MYHFAIYMIIKKEFTKERTFVATIDDVNIF